ncbi:MAG: SpoIVB peptidase S55 domain-containing protein, partial [bacterium]
MTRKVLRFIFPILLSLLGFALSFDPKTMMRVKDIKPGMKGYGLTVFKGTKIEKFDVEILGVLPKDNITGDVILARLSGGPITQRNAKVIAGMSGSPVYINGKLIGAVALTWRYSLEPLAGITPIENMIVSANKEVPIGGAQLRVKSSLLREMGIKTTGNDEYVTMVPIAIPLIASGFHPKALEKASSIFEKAGFIFMQSPGGGKMQVKAPLVPG